MWAWPSDLKEMRKVGLVYLTVKVGARERGFFFQNLVYSPPQSEKNLGAERERV